MGCYYRQYRQRLKLDRSVREAERSPADKHSGPDRSENGGTAVGALFESTIDESVIKPKQFATSCRWLARHGI